jgi:hypothetical protein
MCTLTKSKQVANCGCSELTRFIGQLHGVPRFSEVELALMEARLGRMHLYWPQSRTYFSTAGRCASKQVCKRTGLRVMAYIMHCAVGCISVE